MSRTRPLRVDSPVVASLCVRWCVVLRGLTWSWGAAQDDIDAHRANGDWQQVHRSIKSFDVSRTTAAFCDGDALTAYAATVRAEAALRTRRVADARSFIDEALSVFPKFAVSRVQRHAPPLHDAARRCTPLHAARRTLRANDA